MVLHTLLAATVAVASSSEIRVALPELSGVGLEKGLVSFYSEHLAQQLTLQGVRVVTAKEIATLLGVERQKQLLGCTEAAQSCIAELANALGAEGILMGDVAKVGTTYQLNLKVLAAASGKRLAQYTSSSESEEQVLRELSKAAQGMAAALATSLGRTLKPDLAALTALQQSQSRAGFRKVAWVPALAGAVLAGGGTAALVIAGGKYRQLDAPSGSYTLGDARALRDDGKLLQTFGWVGVGVGAAALATGGLLLFLGREPDSSSTAAISVGAGPGFVTVSGRLP